MTKHTPSRHTAQQDDALYEVETELEPSEEDIPVSDHVPADVDGLVWTDEPSDEDAPEPDYSPDLTNVETHAFWDARPEFRTIHDYAKAKMASPYAVLASVLANVVAATPHTVVLPAIIGSEASLNMFVGFVGKSGDGKGIAESVAGDAVHLNIDKPVFRNSVVSGQAFHHIFAERRKVEGSSDLETVRTNFNAIISVQEIDMLTAMAKQQGSTIMPTLRSVAMGERLGGVAATSTARITIEPMTYRLCLTAGIQPERSESLFGDTAGGTPQRFIYVSAADPDVLDFPVEPPEPLFWTPPNWSLCESKYKDGTEWRVIKMPDIVVKEVWKARADRQRENSDATDGHWMLAREKVAASLAILDGRHYVTEEDWELSLFLMRHSDRQREKCFQACQAQRNKNLKSQGIAQGIQQAAASEYIETKALEPVATRITTILGKAGEKGLSRRDVEKLLGTKQQGMMDSALDLLTSRDLIETYESEYNKKVTTKYRIRSSR